ncbi:MAG: nucleotidyltransferase [Flavobacteriaceae bacterium]|nr:MAG: nucleotidyltransferase [Flavobacteriaceae bacterium]
MKAMIFAAGFGTRLKPFTLSHPKALCPVNNIPLLERNILYLQSFGIKDFVINVHYFADQIRDFLKQKDYFGCNIEISDETDAILETGGGLLKARPFLENETFVLMNVDILTDLNLDLMLKQHQEKKALVTLAASDRSSSRKLLFDDLGRLCGWRNTSDQDQKIVRESDEYNPLAFSGVHIIEPELFSLFRQEGKFSIIETYLDLAPEQKIFSFDHTGGILVDVGKPESVIEAEKWFK